MGGHGSMKYTCDAGFHCRHQGVLQSAQIEGIVFVSTCLGCGGGGWAWYIQVMQGCINEAMYYEKFK